jgi:hypothetical protein
MLKVFKPLIAILFLYAFSYVIWGIVFVAYILEVVIYWHANKASPFLNSIEPILDSVNSIIFPICPLWWAGVVIISVILLLLFIFNLIKYVYKRTKKNETL